jgi:hypothetical protein
MWAVCGWRWKLKVAPATYCILLGIAVDPRPPVRDERARAPAGLVACSGQPWQTDRWPKPLRLLGQAWHGLLTQSYSTTATTRATTATRLLVLRIERYMAYSFLHPGSGLVPLRSPHCRHKPAVRHINVQDERLGGDICVVVAWSFTLPYLSTRMYPGAVLLDENVDYYTMHVNTEQC